MTDEEILKRAAQIQQDKDRASHEEYTAKYMARQEAVLDKLVEEIRKITGLSLTSHQVDDVIWAVSDYMETSY